MEIKKLTPELLAMRGLVASLPDEQRAAVNRCAESIREAVADAGEIGQIALALVGIELQASED